MLLARLAFAVLLLSLAGAARSQAQSPEAATFRSQDGTAITGWLLKPDGPGPHPAVVLLHGCGGLWNSNNSLTARHRDWADRLVSSGFVVLLPDSFRSRGYESVCRLSDRRIHPRGRAADALAAADWLAEQSFVAPRKIGLIGWSNGGSTVLNTVMRGVSPHKTDFRAAVAFYPGCRTLLEKGGWTPRLPLTILHGEADDWTPIEPCKALAAANNVPLVAYPEAHHGFDAPNNPIKTSEGMAFTGSGTGKVTTGTNEPARQDAIRRVMAILRGM